MRKVLFPIVLAASALVAAGPAAAQYYPQPQGYGYGYNNPYNHGQIRVFLNRVDQLQRDVHRFDREGRLSSSDAARIYHRAEEVRQRLIQASYDGLNRRERLEFDRRLDMLRANMRNEMRQYRGDGRRYQEADRWDRDQNWDRDDRWDRAERRDEYRRDRRGR